MNLQQNISLLNFNTFGIDVNADYLIEYFTVEDLTQVLQSETVKNNSVLQIGMGSNLLFMNDFKGVILHSQINTLQKIDVDEQTVIVEAGSGVVWDDFVAFAVRNSWGGVENLSLIPGEVGAAAVQNIGAYGVEVQDVIDKVYAVEINSGKTRDFSNAECKYDYRKSVFKNELKGQFIITSVTFRLQKNPVYNLNYQHIENAVKTRGEINLENIRQTIIAIREEKLPDPKLTGNAGSFFMNPVISTSHFYELQSQFPTIPHYFVSETEEKVPAAWLIDQCGWKGKQIGNAAVHAQQALVLVNKGGATGAEIANLAHQIQLSVNEKFGIALIPEVNFIC
ncbi:MAG TPA: UDP-N-acetylmuramate dehydrogenase [Paludibacter sp.]|nr:UDP-N-acetylmuramate dehydrogenase [Paludibacter sp.]